MIHISGNFKNNLKVLLQTGILPRIYRHAVRHTPVRKGYVLFADSNHKGLSRDFRTLYEAAKRDHMDTEIYSGVLQNMSPTEAMHFLTGFMKKYAAAEYVFINNYFIPVSACDKRQETTVIQLWHACGALKKTGYDAPDDIPPGYRGTPTKNFDYVTVSAPAAVESFSHAFRIPRDRVLATGIARTDLYYDRELNRKKKALFYADHPEARGKKICLYAPTFSGNASCPACTGLSSLVRIFGKLEDWYLIVSPHPQIQRFYPQYRSSVPTEDFFPVADLLITDYSSAFFDFLLYQKPVLFYAPDYREYKKNRGFYHDLTEFPWPLVETPGDLLSVLKSGKWQTPPEDLQRCRDRFMSSCDGHATERISALLQSRGGSEMA